MAGPLGCGHDMSYVGHAVDVGRLVLYGESDDAHPDGHGVTCIEHAVRTSTVRGGERNDTGHRDLRGSQYG